MNSSLRLRSSTSASTANTRSSMASCASTMRWRVRPKDGQPALALTDLGNLFGLVKFYTAARGEGVKPIVGCDVWIEQRGRARQAVSRTAAGAEPRRLPPTVRTADAGLPVERYRGRAELAREWLRRGRDGGLIALSGAMAAMSARRCSTAIPTWRASSPTVGALVSRCLLPRSAARRAAADGEPCASGRATGRPARAAGGGHASGAVPRPDDFRAHEARVCIAEGYVLGDSAGRANSPRSSTSRRRPRWRNCSPTCRRRWKTRWRSPAAATCR